MKDNRQTIIKNMYGRWEQTEIVPHYDKELDVTTDITMKYNLTIDEENMHFVSKRNDEILVNDVEKVSGAHWTGHNNEFLHFHDGHKYFIENATETKLTFGILHTLGTFNGHQSYIDLKKMN